MITPPQLWWSATLAAQDPHDPPHVRRHPLAGVLHHDGWGWHGWVDGGWRIFADGVPDDAVPLIPAGAVGGVTDAELDAATEALDGHDLLPRATALVALTAAARARLAGMGDDDAR